MSAAATELEGKMEAAKNSAKGLKSSLNAQAIGKGFSEFGSAIMSGVFAMESLDAVTKIVEDDSLTMKEKIDKSLMSIVMLGTMGVSALTSLANGYKSVSAGVREFVAAQKSQLALNTLGEISEFNKKGDINRTKTLANIVGENFSALSATKQNEALAAARKLAADSATEHDRAILQEIVGLNAETVGLRGAEKASAEKKIATQLASKELGMGTTKSLIYAAALKISGQSAYDAAGGVTAFSTALKGAGKAALPILAVIAAIAALGIALKALYDDYNKDAIAAERAATAAKEAAAAYSEASKAYNTLTQDISQYEEARKGLSELEEGTDSWKNKLMEVNDQVLDLLDKYPQLAEYVSTASTGEMIISSTGLDSLKEQISSQKKIAQLSSIGAQVNAREANVERDKTDLARKIRYTPSQETKDDRIISETILDVFSNSGLQQAAAAQYEAAGTLSLFGQKELSEQHLSEAEKSSKAVMTKQISHTDLDEVISNAIEKGYTNLKDLSDPTKAAEIATDPAQIDAITSNADQISNFIQEQTNADNENSAAIQAICNSILAEVSGKSPTEGMSSIAANMYEKERAAVAEK